MTQFNQDQLAKKNKQDKFNQQLNEHIDIVSSMAGPSWRFILTYIENQATLKKVDHKVATDVQLAREYCIKSEINRIYRRLAQIEE